MQMKFKTTDLRFGGQRATTICSVQMEGWGLAASTHIEGRSLDDAG
jgi:hypothetical protein